MKSRPTSELYHFYDATSGNCYYIDVVVPTPFGKTAYFYALIDTGADDLVLPSAFLPDFFGSAMPSYHASVGTAGGSVAMPIFHGHKFQVDGVTVTSDVVFAPFLGHAAALCGRVPLMQCSPKFGLRPNELLRQ